MNNDTKFINFVEAITPIIKKVLGDNIKSIQYSVERTDALNYAYYVEIRFARYKFKYKCLYPFLDISEDNYPNYINSISEDFEHRLISQCK